MNLYVSYPNCPANSHYESCGTACPLTCDNYKNPPRACVLMCNPGCHCDEGYVKAKDGSCVEPEECPSSDMRGASLQALVEKKRDRRIPTCSQIGYSRKNLN
ncbi:UNVERIFIED_CONTAM: Venom peptide SjAPI-2 [Trichonephila clavipes]